MVIDVWSDIACPFCYIGKRRLEAALRRRDADVEVRWHAFQLDPEFAGTGEDYRTVLARKKGWTDDYVRGMTDHVAAMAREAGLTFDFDRAVPVNTRDAHRLARMAADHGLQDAVEERLFAAHFTEGQDVSDPDVLARLGADAGLDAEAVRAMLAGTDHADAVEADQLAAYRMGVRGVPFFVFDGRLGLSGAQPVEVFEQALDQARPASEEVAGGEACGPDRDC